MAEVVDRQRNFIPDDVPDLFHILLQPVEALFRQVDPGKGMRNILAVVGPVPPEAAFLLRGGFRRSPVGLMDFRHHAQRRVDRAGFSEQFPQPKVHLQEGESLVHPGFQGFAHLGSGMLALHIRIAVAADPVPVFAAEHLINRHAVSLAGKIPQAHLHGADAAALPGGPAELLHPPEQLFHVAGIFPQQAALEHFRVHPVAAVPDLAETHDPLVGINLHQGAVHRGADDVREADIRDLQFAGKGAAVDFGRNHFRHFAILRKVIQLSLRAL